MQTGGPYYYCWRCGGAGIDPKSKPGENWPCVVCAPMPEDAYAGRHKVNPFPPSERT